MEPADLWQRYMPPEYAHAAPIGLTELERDMRVRVKNHTLLRIGHVRPQKVDGRKTGWREEHASVYADPEARRLGPGVHRAGHGRRGPRPGRDVPEPRAVRARPRLRRPHRQRRPRAGLRVGDRAGLQRLAGRLLQGVAGADVRRRDGRPARHRRRRPRGAPLRGGARVQGGVPRAGLRQRPALAPPRLRPAVGRDRAARRAAQLPRRRADLPHARLLAARCSTSSCSGTPSTSRSPSSSAR